MTEEEYASARSTVNDAFYTDPDVAAAVGQILVNCGYTEGNLLEPSMGVGHIIGSLPVEQNFKRYGVEIDSISGRIAKLLYPNMEIQIKGYQNTTYSDGFLIVRSEMCLLVITNHTIQGITSTISKYMITFCQNCRSGASRRTCCVYNKHRHLG